ncbi:hypothetical protein EDB86DRAFT_1233161 [Lactarius hatsudake]|nr:hypothetical protein EDB86DRAFT_1233161 [Lactarius hatsudake]
MKLACQSDSVIVETCLSLFDTAARLCTCVFSCVPVPFRPRKQYLSSTVFLSVQHSDIPPRVWNMGTSPVCIPRPCGRALGFCLRKHASSWWRRGRYHQRWRKDIAAEDDCTTACSGDPLHPCGGSWRLQLYLWDSNLNT